MLRCNPNWETISYIIYADGHTRKADGLISVGYVVYEIGNGGKRVFEGGNVFRHNVEHTIEGEYVAVLVAAKEFARKNLGDITPAILINDNPYVVDQLNSNGRGNHHSYRLKTLCRLISKYAANIPITEFLYAIKLRNQRMREAHEIADDWSKKVQTLDLEKILN